MRYDPNDVVEPHQDAYAAAASYAAGAPVGMAPGGVAYPLYGTPPVPNGNGAPAPNGLMAGGPAGLIARLKAPAIGFVLGAAVMGGVWFYFGHWLPLKKKAKGRR